MKNIFNKIWNWIKNIFTNWYTKEQWTTKKMQGALENVIANLDMNKNGKVSIKEVVEALRDVLKLIKK